MSSFLSQLQLDIIASLLPTKVLNKRSFKGINKSYLCTNANKQFINVFVKAFTKSDATEPQFGKSTYRLKKVSCNNQPDSNAACVSAPNHFGLGTQMLYDVINYNDITSTTCSHEYARKVSFTDVQTIKSFGVIYWGSKLFDRLPYLHEVLIDSSVLLCGQHKFRLSHILINK